VLRRVVDGWHVPQALAGVCVLQGVAVLPVVAVCRRRQSCTAIIGSVAVCHRVLQGVAGCCKVCVARCRRQQWYANQAQQYAGICRNQDVVDSNGVPQSIMGRNMCATKEILQSQFCSDVTLYM